MSKTLAWLTQAFFVVSMFSGLIIVFAYHPSDAYDSIQKLNYIIPFGSLFRKLHYFSSEAFLIVLLAHIATELFKKNIKISGFSWYYSLLGTLIVILLMFTGFILKADQSANAAAQVAFSLIGNTPLLDKCIPLFKDSTVFYWKFFVWHSVFLPIILSYAIHRHVKKLSVNIRYFTLTIGISMLLILLFDMPNDIALEAKIEHLKGPWFFWGSENLLQFELNSLAVNAILILPFIFLILLYRSKHKKLFKFLLLLWVLAYAFISI